MKIKKTWDKISFLSARYPLAEIKSEIIMLD